MKRILYILHLVTLTLGLALAMSGCADDFAEVVTPSATDDKGIGELVLFSAGNSGNTTTRAVIPYMELDGRFVCKMFYHAKATDTDAEPFDTVSTPITSWLRVNDNEGNSVYWRNDYDMAGVDKGHQDYLDYGFDSRAQYFYWRNRLDHVFLAYTDFNLLKTNTYSMIKDAKGNTVPAPRSLFMYPDADGSKKTKTGQTVSWPTTGFKYLTLGMVSHPNPEYDADAAAAWDPLEHGGESYPEPENIETFGVKSYSESGTPPSYKVSFGLTSDISYTYATTEQIRATYNNIKDCINNSVWLSASDRTALLADINRTGPSDPIKTAEGNSRFERWYVGFDLDSDDAYNDDGSINLENSSVVIYCRKTKESIIDQIAIAPANTFDLTRKPVKDAQGNIISYGIDSMSQQPDPLIALTKMKPTGSTQEANRVRLYFKHQFSQIQVNLTKGENTAEIKPENILGVELLGVSEKGYVFTNINPDGTQIPPTYDPVVISHYTEEQQKANPHGTSFQMFDMGTSKPETSIKSFNAIAFGQLQAIRITWKEDDYEEDGETKEGVHHVATYKITVDDRGNSLVNLKSGYRYMYNFELRRGTIAFIRATIDGWLLHDDLNYGTSGTIAPETPPTP